MRGDNRPSPNEEVRPGRLGSTYLDERVRTPRVSNVETNLQRNKQSENDASLEEKRQRASLKNDASSLTFPKITNTNWTASGNVGTENDPPGKWFMVKENDDRLCRIPNDLALSEEQKKILCTTDPLEQSSQEFYNTLKELNFVSEDYLMALLHDKDAYVDSLKKENKEFDKRERHLLKVVHDLKLVADDSRIKLYEVHKKRKVEKMFVLAGRKSMLKDEDYDIDDNEQNEEELDIWQKRSKEYQAKLKAMRMELKAVKETLAKCEEEREAEKENKEAELHLWQNKAFDYQKKYRALYKDFENLKMCGERDEK